MTQRLTMARVGNLRRAIAEHPRGQRWLKRLDYEARTGIAERTAGHPYLRAILVQDLLERFARHLGITY